MEKGEIEANAEFAESFLPPVIPEDSVEVPSPPEVPPPFNSEVIEKVMAAAEQDLPQEREYELRHERKGENNDPLATAAVSVGEVLAQSSSNRTLPINPDTALNNHIGTTKQGVGLPLSPTELYKRAVVFGFISGIAVVVTLAIITVIR